MEHTSYNHRNYLIHDITQGRSSAVNFKAARTLYGIPRTLYGASIGQLDDDWRQQSGRLKLAQRGTFFDIKPQPRTIRRATYFTRIAPLGSYQTAGLALAMTPTYSLLPAAESVLEQVSDYTERLCDAIAAGWRAMLAFVPAFIPRIYKLNKGRVIDWHTKTFGRLKRYGAPLVAAVAVAALALNTIQLQTSSNSQYYHHAHTQNSVLSTAIQPTHTTTNDGNHANGAANPTTNAASATDASKAWCSCQPMTPATPMTTNTTTTTPVQTVTDTATNTVTDTTAPVTTTNPVDTTTPVTTDSGSTSATIPPVTVPSVDTPVTGSTSSVTTPAITASVTTPATDTVNSLL